MKKKEFKIKVSLADTGGMVSTDENRQACESNLHLSEVIGREIISEMEANGAVDATLTLSYEGSDFIDNNSEEVEGDYVRDGHRTLLNTDEEKFDDSEEELESGEEELDDSEDMPFSKTYSEFRKEVLDHAEHRPKGERLGQSVFNYIDSKYGVARYVQFGNNVDCFYDDDCVESFIFLTYTELKYKSTILYS